MLAVEIHYYGTPQPITIPITKSDRAAAESYFQRLKSDVIDAQRHNRSRLSIRPFDPTQETQEVEPFEIQRVELVDRPTINDATDAA
jgi:hypothetical protein